MGTEKIYNFDKIIDRKGTGAVKSDGLKKVFGKDDLLPLWVEEPSSSIL